VKYLLLIASLLIMAAIAALAIDHAMKASASVYNQYDQEVGMQ
jgi:hypothetical protein